MKPSSIASKTVMGYLLNEMNDEEREKFEKELFVNDELFFEVADAENALIDQYVAGQLSEADVIRFESVLGKLPAWTSKIQNARALKELIGSESRLSAETPAEHGKGLLAWLSNWFTIGSPQFASAFGVLTLVFAGFTGFFVHQNSIKNAEIAKLNQELASDERLSNLKAEVSESLNRIGELQAGIDTEREVSGDLIAELERERLRSERLEHEISVLKGGKSPDKKTSNPSGIAAVTLRPGEVRGTGDAPMGSLPRSVERISVLLTLPAEIDPAERLSVRLNGREIVSGVAIRTDAAGNKSLPLTVSSDQLQQGRNLFTAHDKNGEKVSEYTLTADKEDE